MKKLFSVLSILVIVSPLFSQNVNSQITDYFPVGIGNTWNYASGTGKTAEVITMRNSMPDNVSNDGTSLYLFERQFVGIGSGSTLYSIKQNKVVIMVEKNIFGQYQQKSNPILAPAGQEWRYNDRGDDLRYKASKSLCSFDGKAFIDCILVEEQIVDGRNVLRTKKSYYAKGVGLVYVTLQEAGEEETCYQKLIDCNFVDIKNVSIKNENSEWGDVTKALLFFFARLAQDGLVGADNEGVKLENGNQTVIFNALCQIAKKNVSIVLDMVSLDGSIKIGTYLDSPVPYSLNTIFSSNGKPFAIAIDKAIKIIVISNILQELPKISVPDPKILGGIKEAGPSLSNLYKVDSSISNEVESFYKLCIGVYIQYGGK